MQLKSSFKILKVNLFKTPLLQYMFRPAYGHQQVDSSWFKELPYFIALSQSLFSQF
jgi:hypothetical protein